MASAGGAGPLAVTSSGRAIGRMQGRILAGLVPLEGATTFFFYLIREPLLIYRLAGPFPL